MMLILLQYKHDFSILILGTYYYINLSVPINKIERFINTRYLTNVMQLQKQLSRKVGNTEYAKFVIVIPPEEVKKIGWKVGEELQIEVKHKKAIITSKESL